MRRKETRTEKGKRKRKTLWLLIITVGIISLTSWTVIAKTNDLPTILDIIVGYVQRIVSSDKKEPSVILPNDKADTSISGAVQDGALNLDNVNEIKAQLQKQTDDSVMNYKVNVNPVFENGSSKGNLMIENAKSNKYAAQVEIRDSTTDKLYYKSPVLKPNQSIPQDKLLVDLPKGQYHVVAYFTCYNIETLSFVGKVGFNIKLTVLK